MRTGPGTNYDVVKSVYKGTVLSIASSATGSGYTWGLISNVGWLVLSYTTYGQNVTTHGINVTVTGDAVNVRSGPRHRVYRN